MPPKGLDRARLKEHFRIYLTLYLVGIVAMSVLSYIVFTVTRPRVPDENEVMIYLTGSAPLSEPLDALAADALAYGQTVDPTLQSVCFETVPINDPNADSNSAYLLTARMAVGQGDIWIANQIGATELMNAYAFQPLDDGFAADLGLEVVSVTDEETGNTYRAAVKLAGPNALTECGAMQQGDVYLLLALDSTNADTSRAVAEYLLRRIVSGDIMTPEVNDHA